ncbi:hypothetical protein DESC_350048 [Desulfosarcina cetonica]|nr:hypothetical protein DESC_350048 [Desulfosarcina cetonica]
MQAVLAAILDTYPATDAAIGFDDPLTGMAIHADTAAGAFLRADTAADTGARIVHHPAADGGKGGADLPGIVARHRPAEKVVQNAGHHLEHARRPFTR